MKLNMMAKEEKIRKDVVTFLDKKYPDTGYVLILDDDSSKPIIKLPRKLDMTFLNVVQKYLIHENLVFIAY